jgi:chorismate mutase
MAKAKKKSTKQAAIPPYPAVPLPKEIGELCADVYRHAMKLARQQGLDEQTVEQLALGEIREFMAACIRQSKADWKAYTRTSGVHAAYVQAKKPAKKSAKK